MNEKKETGIIALILVLSGYVFLTGLVIICLLYPSALNPGPENPYSWLSPLVSILVIVTPLLIMVAAFCAAFRLHTAKGKLALALSFLLILSCSLIVIFDS